MEPDGRFVKVAATSDVPIGRMKSVAVDGRPVMLCNVKGQYFAVRDECTHEAFPLSEGDLRDHTVTCMLHGASFDVRTGEVLALPAYESVQTYEVRVEGDDILVSLE